MTDDERKSEPAAAEWRSRPCPVCRKMSDRKYHPFCSRHCADVDLARWLGGRYAIPARPELEEDGEWDSPQDSRNEAADRRLN